MTPRFLTRVPGRMGASFTGERNTQQGGRWGMSRLWLWAYWVVTSIGRRVECHVCSSPGRGLGWVCTFGNHGMRLTWLGGRQRGSARTGGGILRWGGTNQRELEGTKRWKGNREDGNLDAGRRKGSLKKGMMGCLMLLGKSCERKFKSSPLILANVVTLQKQKQFWWHDGIKSLVGWTWDYKKRCWRGWGWPGNVEGSKEMES